MARRFSDVLPTLLLVTACTCFVALISTVILTIPFLKALLIGLLASFSTFVFLFLRSIKPLQNNLKKLAAAFLENNFSELGDVKTIDLLGEKLKSTEGKTRGVSKTCSDFAIAGAVVSFSSDVLKNSIDEQINKVEKLAETSSIVSENIEQAAEETSYLNELSTLTSEASVQGQEAIHSANKDMKRTDQQVQ